MATSYTTSLRLSEPSPGDPLVKNQWGTILNTNMVLIDSAVTGTASVNIGGLTSYSLTVGNGTADQARCQFYSFTGALTGDCTVTMPTVPKVVWAANLTTGGHNVILTTGGGTTVTLPNNSTWALIRCDGTNVSNMSVQFSSTVATGTASVTGALSCSGLIQITTNNTYFWGKDTGGTSRALMGVDTGNYTLYFSAGSGYRWANAANNAERMKLTDGGTLTVPGSVALGGSNTSPLGVANNWAFTAGSATGYNGSGAPLFLGTGAIGSLVNFYFGLTLIGSITTTGAAVAYNTTSDYRLKDVYGPADSSWVATVPIYDAAWKDDPEIRRPMALAHELPPWLVSGAKDAIDENGKIIPQQVDWFAAVPSLIDYIQKLEARIAVLEAR